jgi:SAM-dependent methyltransferase
VLGALKRSVSSTPWLGPAIRSVIGLFPTPQKAAFPGSADYWQTRYCAGGDSGSGSYGRLARFKAKVLNGFVHGEGVRTVLELGCGDGAQLARARYPSYVGADVSAKAVELCCRRFAGDATKRFYLQEDLPASERAELVLSLDVIFHLVEDEAFERYMAELFDRAERWVLVYASDGELVLRRPHVRHRRFTAWVAEHRPQWRLAKVIRNPYPYDERYPDSTSPSDFHLFERAAS